MGFRGDDAREAKTASRLVRVFGLDESEILRKLSGTPWGKNISITVREEAEDSIVLIEGRGYDSEAAKRAVRDGAAEAARALGDFVVGVDVPSLEQVVAAELSRQGKKVSAAESCTGGLIAKRITDVPGSSAIFGLGVVSYSNEAKINVLGVDPVLLRDFGAVSPQVALAMAKGCARLARADYGIGVTGIAGPDGGSPEKPVGLVYIALTGPEGDWSWKTTPRIPWAGRDWVRRRTASRALDLLRRRLAGLPPGGSLIESC
ncbi:MAG: nicotinamide-nucleotide amidohydrolase family protein [Desulfovibrio sp.]|nr:nicotinamide-nucleotide amidohydrolase family protein [Desulfovibrio sp.]